MGRTQTCGFYGCTLPNLHPGLCEVEQPSKRTRHGGKHDHDIDVESKRTRHGKLFHDDIDVDKVDECVVYSASTQKALQALDPLQTVRVQVAWIRNGLELFKGTIIRVRTRGDKVLVSYDDGDVHWERRSECHEVF